MYLLCLSVWLTNYICCTSANEWLSVIITITFSVIYMYFYFFLLNLFYLNRYFEELGSLSPLKPDRGMEVFRAELDMGAFELLTCSPVKVIMCAVMIYSFTIFCGMIWIIKM